MPQPSPERRVEDGCDAQPAPAASPNAAALDEVVRATLESADADERVTSEEVEALRDVARRRGDVPLVLEPVAVELVEAIINVNYGKLRRAPEVWHAAAVKIANVLFESPATHARLENLWRRLIESR